MANPEEIEQELRQFLAIEDTIRKSDKIVYLMAIINKHYSMDQITHVASHHDLGALVDDAKRMWASTKMPMVISKKEVDNQYVNYVLILEAFVGYLNQHKLLKKLIKFDHTRR